MHTDTVLPYRKGKHYILWSQVLTSCVTFALLKNCSVKCALVAGTQEMKAEKLSQNCYHEREQITVSYVLAQVKTTT